MKESVQLLAHLYFVALTVGHANYSHLTWLSILVTFFVLVLYELDLAHRVFWAYQSLQFSVVMGVVVLSWTDCSVLENTFTSVGWAVYIAGNFLMHYAGSPIVLLVVGDRGIYTTKEDVVRQGILSLAGGLVSARPRALMGIADSMLVASAGCNSRMPRLPTGARLRALSEAAG